MKTTHWLSLAPVAALAFSQAPVHSSEIGCSPPALKEPTWCGGEWDSCRVTVQWTEPVDLDGDEVPDFLHRRVTAHSGCGDEWAGFRRDDEIEAFYPEPHVDVWTQYHTAYPTEAWWWALALTPGEVVGDPSWRDCSPPTLFCRTWASERPVAQPTLQAEGLGVIYRRTDAYPCLPDGYGCGGGGRTGAILLADPLDQTAIGLFGFRIQQADGWHLAWLRILFDQPWPWSFDERPVGGLSLLDYAIHPEPETPIAAGEPPRPTLHASVEGDEIVLSWYPNWTGFVLERSPAITGSAWDLVPGVENNSIRLPKAGPPAFFRLKQE